MSGERGNDLNHLSHPCQTRKSFLESQMMSVGIAGGASIFDDYEGEAEACALTSGRFDTNISGDTRQHDRVDSPLLQYLL
jgi:hypothetical protein